MTDVKPPEQEIRPTPSLKEVLMQSTFAPGRAIPDSLRAIELGIFADEGRELIRQTLDDPQRREFGKLVTVKSDTRKMRIYKTEVGTEGHVEHEQQIAYHPDLDPTLPRHQRIIEMWVTGMHSHPVDVSPSSGDLTSIFLGDFDPRAETAVFVVTPSRFILVFRGNNAPHLTFEEATTKRDMWEKSMQERMKQFTNPSMPPAEQVVLNERERTQLLRQISTKYDLKIFSGDLNGGIVQLQS